MKQKKLLVTCPNCKLTGKRRVFGEVMPRTGNLFVKRVIENKNSTYTQGAIYDINSVICTDCGREVYKKDVIGSQIIIFMPTIPTYMLSPVGTISKY